MVDVKTAVSTSLAYLREMMPVSELHDLQLEEVMLTDDEKYWLVTVSYTKPEGLHLEAPGGDVETAVKNAFPFNHLVTDTRFFKTIKVRRADGAFFGLTNLVA